MALGVSFTKQMVYVGLDTITMYLRWNFTTIFGLQNLHPKYQKTRLSKKTTVNSTAASPPPPKKKKC